MLEVNSFLLFLISMEKAMGEKVGEKLEQDI